MKKYKTWEMVKALQENPNLKFVTRALNERECDLAVFLENGTLRTSSHTDAFMAVHLLKWEWELIQAPVSFMEAVKAYSEGKTIRCELNGEEIGTMNPKNNECIFDNYGIWMKVYLKPSKLDVTLSTGLILNGKFYVEE